MECTAHGCQTTRSMHTKMRVAVNGVIAAHTLLGHSHSHKKSYKDSHSALSVMH
jgi:hypothetical protein